MPPPDKASEHGRMTSILFSLARKIFLLVVSLSYFHRRGSDQATETLVSEARTESHGPHISAANLIDDSMLCLRYHYSMDWFGITPSVDLQGQISVG